MDDFLHRPLGEHERFGDGGIVLALRHCLQHVAFARSQLGERRLLGARLRRDERLDHLRVDHGSTVCDRANCGAELRDVVDSLLEEICAAGRAALQQGERVARVCVLTEDDHADLRMRLAETRRRLDPLVGPARRHANVGNHDVGLLGGDGGEQRIEIGADRDHFEVGLRLE